MKAQKSDKGIHSKSGAGGVRVVELSNDLQKAKQFLPFLLRGSSNARKDGVVEFVFSASRIKIFIPKENCLMNLILAGVNAPKNQEAYAAEAQAYVKRLIHQKDIQLTVEAMDRVGNYIGLLYFDDKNLSVELLKQGFGRVRDDRGGEYSRAENEAREQRLNVWKDFKEEEPEPKDSEEGGDVIETLNEKEDNRKAIVITMVSKNMTSFYAQKVEDGERFEELMSEMREELSTNPPLPGAYHPKKLDYCAAKYSADGQWYRARIEKITGASEAQVLFIDYGNREQVAAKDLGPLPSSKFDTSSFPAAAKEYGLAFVGLPAQDLEGVEDARDAFSQDTGDKVLLMRSEYRDANSNLECVTLADKDSKKDIVLALVTEGYFMVDVRSRREKRLFKIISEYKSAQETAKKKRLCLWQYGDFTEDDAKEFGLPKTA
jgi:staphylococcal nuclease domain-containing protein 1